MASLREDSVKSNRSDDEFHAAEARLSVSNIFATGQQRVDGQLGFVAGPQSAVPGSAVSKVGAAVVVPAKKLGTVMCAHRLP